MTSANPPTYSFNGLNYNSQFFTSTSSSINSALYMTTTTAQSVSGQKTFTTDLISNGGISGSGAITTTNTTDSSSTSTGALIVAGGAGIAQNMNVGGTIRSAYLVTTNGIYVNGSSSFYNNAVSMGSLTVTGTLSLPNYSVTQSMVSNGYVDLVSTQSSIAGAKTFTSLLTASNGLTVSSGTITGTLATGTTVTASPTYPDSTTKVATTAFVSSNFVDKTTDQTVGGIKTFSSVPICSTNATTNTQLTNKSYVDTALGSYVTTTTANNTYGALSGTNAWSGTNTFNTNLPTSTLTPSTQYQLTNKSYVDTQVATKVSSQWTTTGSDIYYTTGKVGVGITNPTALLHLYSTSANRTNTLYISSPQAGIELDSTQSTNAHKYNIWSVKTGETMNVGSLTIFDETASAYRFTLDGSGNVCLGSKAPLHNLAVVSSNPSVCFSGNSESDSVTLFFGTPFNTYGSTAGLKTAIIAQGGQGYSRSKLHFCLNNSDGSTDPNNTAVTSVTDARMTILPSGYVGIANTSPAKTLDVTGEGRFSSTLTASNGLTVSAGTVSFPSGSISTSAIASGFVDTTNAQSIGGAKTFSSTLTASNGLTVSAGTVSFPSGSISTSAISSGFVDTTNTQSIGGAKTFTSALIANSVSGFYFSSNANCKLQETYGIKYTAPSGIYPFQISSSSLCVGYDGNGSANYGTNNLYVAGSVGVGTSSASALLHLYSTSSNRTNTLYINAPQAGIELDSTQSTNAHKYNIFSTISSDATGAGSLAIYDDTSGAYRMVINNSGNIGVGTVSPSHNMAVVGSSPKVCISANNETDPVTLYFGTPFNTYGSTGAYKTAIIAEGQGYSRSKLHFCLNNDLDNSSSYTASVTHARMTILPSGNVGINTTSPAYTLDVNGSANISSNLTVGGTLTATLPTSTTQQFTKISIGGAVASIPLYVYNTNKGNLSGSAYGALTSTGATSGSSFSSTLGVAYFQGAIHCDGVIYSTSDIRMKNILETKLDSINIIDNLNVVQYKWKDFSQGDKIYTGFIAQEVKKVFEDAINYYENYIPDIMQSAVYKGDKICLVNHGLLPDDEIQLIDDNRNCTNTKVTNILSPDEFEVSDVIETEKVFIFGKKTNDIHNLDYQSLFAVSVDATKELIKKNRELEDKVSKIEAFLQSKFPDFNL